MISGPLAPDLTTPAGPWAPPGTRRSRTQLLGFAGLVLVATSLVVLVAWLIFVSPLGFTRYSVTERDRTFTIHRAGTYVVYYEFPEESQASLPPAIEIGVVALSGQEVDVHPIGNPGIESAPWSYDLGGHEGRAFAVIDAHRAGTFVVSIRPIPAGEVDTSQQRIITQGTIALGREWSRSWMASWPGFGVIVMGPLVAGLTLLVLAWRRHGDPVDGQ